MTQTKFPYKKGDTVIFPDTETEYVDVGIGNVPVAQQQINTICTVVTVGRGRGRRRGFALKMQKENYYSEVFHKREGLISLRDYLDHFGNYKKLIKIRNF